MGERIEFSKCCVSLCTPDFPGGTVVKNAGDTGDLGSIPDWEDLEEEE